MPTCWLRCGPGSASRRPSPCITRLGHTWWDCSRRALQRPILVVTARSGRARQWVDELRIWLPDEIPVQLFADPDALPYERIPWASETRQRRLEALVGLLAAGDTSRRGEVMSAPVEMMGASSGVAPIIVTSARALMQMTLPVREMRAALRPIRKEQRFDLNKMLLSWVGLGYESMPVVEMPGRVQPARRHRRYLAAQLAPATAHRAVRR